MALEQLSKLRQEFFNSSYNQKALLMTADIYFNEKKYLQALKSYQKYQKLYPESKTDYILYQTALAYNNQLPKRAEQDLSFADLALTTLKPLIAKPSPFQEKALKLEKELLNKKAEKDLKRVLFHKNQKQYSTGFKRVKDLLKNYPESSSESKALLTAFQLAEKLNEDSKVFKQKLLEKHPQSLEARLLTNPSFFQSLKNKIL